MIPNVFVSSTIDDLKYLRDALWEVIEDLAYHPVMSERSGVGYIHPQTAAASCYGSVQQCHLMVLIIGRRYGWKDTDGYSVTHKEFRAAQEAGVPMITFVDEEVLHLKKLYDTNPSKDFWSTINGLDDPAGTFALLSEVQTASGFNGILPIKSAPESKRMLKLQLADFVGTKLSGSTVNQQVSDVLAEVKTLRSILLEKHDGAQLDAERANRLYALTRFLVDDRRKEYRELLEKIFPSFDVAVTAAAECESFDKVLEKANVRKEVQSLDARSAFATGFNDVEMSWAQFSPRGNVVMGKDGVLHLDDSRNEYYSAVQAGLRLLALGSWS